ncbi:MFS transporter [Acetobacterium sp. UBA5834]|uniref:MFS transporter n=1 Tax=Acetobacterium sp. UBA5834 TaxID=1945907 RepID=UPI0025805DE3|nr:MFS transporter [Acetobacterium sp. UBA5834]
MNDGVALEISNVKQIRWRYLLVGSVVLLFAGIIHAWSILKAPFAAEFKWDAAQLALNYTLTLSFFCIGGFVAGLLSKKIGTRMLLVISAALLFVGFFITSRLSGDNVSLLYLAYGALAGSGIGIVYITIIGVVNAWFPDKKGLCSGTLMMSFGFSALIIGRTAATVMSMPSVGWRSTFLILAFVTGGVILLAAFVIKKPPQDASFPTAKTKAKAVQGDAVINDYTALEMISRVSFWLIFIFFMLLCSVGIVAIAFAKDLFVVVGSSPEFAATMVGILAIFNGLGRIISGAIFDRYGVRTTQFAASATAIVSPALVLLAITSGSLVIGIIGLCLCGVTYGFCPTLSASFTSAFYGTKNFSLNFSIMNLVLIPASFAATIAGSLLKSTGSFTVVFIILISCSVLGLLINIFIKRP